MISGSCLQRRWLHSQEEDTGEIRVYRSSSIPLPPTRAPRHVLEFANEERVISRVGGPADSRVAREGRWDVVQPEPLILRLTWDDLSGSSLEVIECSDTVLQIRILTGSID